MSQLFYEIYLPKCTCTHPIGKYYGLIYLYRQQNYAWPDIFTHLHIDNVCCKTSLMSPVTRLFDHQVDNVINGIYDPTTIDVELFDLHTALNIAPQRVVFPNVQIPNSVGIAIDTPEEFKEPVYVGRPMPVLTTGPTETSIVGKCNNVEIKTTRMHMKYRCG